MEMRRTRGELAVGLLGPLEVSIGGLPVELIASRLRSLLAVLAVSAGQTVPVGGVVHGAAGVGKTSLVVHRAHQVRDRFSDGQLYVNLRGYGTGSAMEPNEAIRAFLDALDVHPQQIPADELAQAGLYRSLLAGKRMLIVLVRSGHALPRPAAAQPGQLGPVRRSLHRQRCAVGLA